MHGIRSTPPEVTALKVGGVGRSDEETYNRDLVLDEVKEPKSLITMYKIEEL